MSSDDEDARKAREAGLPFTSTQRDPLSFIAKRVAYNRYDFVGVGHEFRTKMKSVFHYFVSPQTFVRHWVNFLSGFRLTGASGVLSANTQHTVYGVLEGKGLEFPRARCVGG